MPNKTHQNNALAVINCTWSLLQMGRKLPEHLSITFRGRLQIRAGTGGEEAALFAADLLRMYQKYADQQKWKLSHVSESQAENGGLKEAVVEVSDLPGNLLCVHALSPDSLIINTAYVRDLSRNSHAKQRISLCLHKFAV